MKKLPLLLSIPIVCCFAGCTKSENTTSQTAAQASELNNDAKPGCDFAKRDSMLKFEDHICYCQDDDYALKVALGEGLEINNTEDEKDWNIYRMRDCMHPVLFTDEPESVDYFFATYVTTCDDDVDPWCIETFDALLELFEFDETGVSPKQQLTKDQTLNGIQYIKSYCAKYGTESFSSCSIFNDPDEGCEVNADGAYQCGL